MATVADALDQNRPTEQPSLLAKIGLGSILAGLITPAETTNTVALNTCTLASPGPVLAVRASVGGLTGGKLMIDSAGTPGTIEVAVDYSGATPVLTFAGADAVTTAIVVQAVVPAASKSGLAATWGETRGGE